MMRYIVFILVGLTWALPVVAQNIFTEPLQIEPGNQTNKLLDLDVSVSSERVKTTKNEPDITVISDGFKEGMIGEESEEAAVTHKVQSSKLGFLVSAGVEYADEGEYEDAERAYLRALKLDPDSEEIQFRLGTLYVIMERFPDAIRIFKKMTKQFPENPLPHNNLAWCYATGRGVMNTAKALRHAREAILSVPLSPSAWNTLAEAYYVAGEYKKALRSSEHAIDLLQAGGSPDEVVGPFMAQRTKIIRAEEAMKLFDGLDDE